MLHLLAAATLASGVVMADPTPAPTPTPVAVEHILERDQGLEAGLLLGSFALGVLLVVLV